MNFIAASNRLLLSLSLFVQLYKDTHLAMPKRIGKFELPNRLVKVEEGASPTYAKFIAEPFEAGYGHTIGNSLRRVLLSSIEGAAIASVKIDGVSHEFQSVDGIVEESAAG